MKNTERQEQLDYQKYFESIKCNRDMSGMMAYCWNCKHRAKPYFECYISHEKRVKESACAKAYNQMKKKEK